MVHPTTIIDSGALIHPTASIGAFCHIYSCCEIWENVQISDCTILGSPAEHKTKPTREAGKIIIGNGTIIREQVTIQAPVEEDTVIGAGCYIMNKVHIGHDCRIGRDSIIASGAVIGGVAKCEEHSYFGVNSSVHPRAIMGRYFYLSAQGFFKGVSPDGIMWIGVPAKPVKVNMKELQKYKPDDMDKIIKEAEWYLGAY